MEFTHLDAQGRPRMVNVGDKPATKRQATAHAVVVMQPETIVGITENRMKKGDVLTTAKIAGIMAAKKCQELIPMCHAIFLEGVDIDFEIYRTEVHITATVCCNAPTGVEMEALTAASVTALTIYDMCKAVDRGIVIEQMQLEAKSGGKSGTFQREAVYGRLKGINISERKGEIKLPVDKACLVREHGIEHDAHAGAWHRQVSLLGEESIEYMRRTAKMELKFGDFAENLTTEGIELKRLPIGTRLRIGDCAVIEITQIGKECHADCAIKQKIHDCIMPREGIFARVLIGGMIYPGDVIRSL